MLSTPLSHFIFQNVTYKLHFVFSHNVIVEFEKAETTSTSTNIRTTASSPLRYLSPVIRFLTPFLAS